MTKPQAPAPPVPRPASQKRAKRRPLLFGIAIGFVLGLSLGYGLGLLSTELGRSFFEGMFRTEERAETSRPSSFQNRWFRISYPGNWSIDEKEEGFAPDSYFSIDSVADSYVAFSSFNFAIDPQQQVEEQRKQFDKMMSGTRSKKLLRWGEREVTGLELEGNFVGNVMMVRIACFAHGEQHFLVVEQTYKSDRPLVEPGFALIRSSFSFR